MQAVNGYRFTLEADASGHEAPKSLGERNPKWLNDDYVKFIRFAQLKMDAVEEGIVGVITNHSWLDNPTFRGMRQSLMRSFQQIYILDLHGNAKKKERAPDGSKDENVFDIEQGVAISLFVKRSGLEAGVWRGDFWGRRFEKYVAAMEGTPATAISQRLEPKPGNYLFLPQDASKLLGYQTGWSLAEVFPINGAGIVTAHDAFVIDFAAPELQSRFERFRRHTGSDADLHRDFQVATKAGWDIRKGWRILGERGEPTESYIRPIAYSPFDRRYIFYQDALVWRTVRRLMDRIVEGNIVLLCSRQTKDEPAALVVCDAFRHKSSTRYDISYGFPLRSTGAGEENLSPDFRAFLDARYDHHYAPEEILGYIYAVLHAPTYRTRYAEFLRIDFPRIPFPEESGAFEALSALGWALVEAHLLRPSLPRKGLADFKGKGDRIIVKPRYVREEQALRINKDQCFKPVPENVWDFHIGGYQVIDKYLKSRKGRVLSLDEINHVAAIADSLAFTIEQMGKIDEAYRAAFPDQG